VAGASEERREKIRETLRTASAPVTGAELASILGVSRQAIVNDIAVLRASGAPIVGSPSGYLVTDGAGSNAVIACKHGQENARAELEILIDHGITVVDVVVEHALYGEVRGNLMIGSRSDVDRYIADLVREEATPLSSLTGGVHLHHLRAPNPDAVAAACRELAGLGILVGG
jgi:transcriptional regulator of NAD metabolism